MIKFIKEVLKEKLIARHRCSDCAAKFVPHIAKGYAYKNDEGKFILIESFNHKGFPVGSDGSCYEWNGLTGGGHFKDKDTLNPLKPYKLVPVEYEEISGIKYEQNL